MPNLYIITGPAGVGKTTVSKKLAENKEKSALIEGDDIYNQVIGGRISPWKEGNHLNIFWKICLNTIDTYLTNGFDVIFNYIVTPDDLRNIKDNFKNYSIKFAILISDEETLLKRDKLRPIDCQMGTRCTVLLESFKKKYEDFDQLVTRNHKVVDRNYSVISQMQIEKIKACYLDQIKQTEIINQLWIPLNRCLLEARRFGVPVQVKDRVTGEFSILDDSVYDQETLQNKVALTDEDSNVLLWYNKWREYFAHTDFTTNQEIDRIAMNQLHLDHDYLQSEEVKQKKLVS